MTYHKLSAMRREEKRPRSILCSPGILISINSLSTMDRSAMITGGCGFSLSLVFWQQQVSIYSTYLSGGHLHSSADHDQLSRDFCAINNEPTRSRRRNRIPSRATTLHIIIAIYLIARVLKAQINPINWHLESHELHKKWSWVILSDLHLGAPDRL